MLTRLILLITLTSIPLVGKADIKVMSEKEFADRMEVCQKKPECKKAYERITKEQAKEQADLDAICQRDQKACQKEIKKEASELAKKMAKCLNSMDNCYKEINQSADAQEEALVSSLRWCEGKPRLCNYIKSLRQLRKETGQQWCDDNKAVCEAVLKRDQVKQAKLEKRRKEAKVKWKQNHLASLRRKLEGVSKERDKKLISCKEPTQCKKAINREIQAMAARRAEQICKKGKDTDLCRVANEITQDLNTKGKKWCDTNVEACNQAKQKALSQQGIKQ